MNQKQRNYVQDRVTAIKKRKIEEIKSRYTQPATILGDDRKVEMIRSGQVSLKPNVRSMEYLKLAYDFSAFEQPALITDQAAIDRETKAVIEEATRIIDTVMLGTEAEALQMLSQFETFGTN